MLKKFLPALHLNFKKITIVFLVSFICSSFSFAQENGNLIIEVKGIKNEMGKVRFIVFSHPHGFPSSPEKAKYIAEGEININSSKIEIKNIPFGEYAVSVMHDENNDGKISKNFLGIPQEGIGVSNDTKSTFGPPRFDQAKFKFTRDKQSIEINMQYY
ncbi:DUF2141 domain-containing protein [Brumimicrobium mesophilum]|uniref:DUF2141 domain-containing protein n=1 Tax=Brumimicrobium mesophilum TaxID=392717 RepID=UPI000D142C71|nr:DUF2141 domain-containing protein [Brumimicrobium mesophilum]